MQEENANFISDSSRLWRYFYCMNKTPALTFAESGREFYFLSYTEDLLLSRIFDRSLSSHTYCMEMNPSKTMRMLNIIWGKSLEFRK